MPIFTVKMPCRIKMVNNHAIIIMVKSHEQNKDGLIAMQKDKG